ncbi:MAG: hypothetical protein E6Q97_02180 [Desulfurellales bacterium]|nr:MAG: hypothetical protein E6Q97_02180 [Desulfurellales bacterium]
MSFWITIIIRPRSKKARELAKAEGFIDIPELGVMIGEHGGIEGISGFVWDPGYVKEQVQSENFDGALNEDISGEARKVLLEMIKIALPRGFKK